MKSLLTGSRGNIGTARAPMLVRTGHEVVGLDTDPSRRPVAITVPPATPRLNPDLRWIKDRTAA